MEQEIRGHLRIVIFFAWVCIGANLWVLYDRVSRSDWAGAFATCTVVAVAAVSTHALHVIKRKYQP